MALVKCRECKRKISDTAQFCPHCGYNYQNASLEKASATNTKKKSHTPQRKISRFWKSIVYVLEDIWDVASGFLLGILKLLLGILIPVGIIAVIFLFIWLVDWISTQNVLLAGIVGFIGFAAVLIAANIACYSTCYKKKRRHEWFFWATLIASIIWYVGSLVAFVGINFR